MNNSMAAASHKTLTDEIADYFAFMAGRFPVMSGTDEFLFFPLVEESFNYRSAMEDLSPELVGETIARSGRALAVADKLAEAEAEKLDLQIDARLLKMHAENFIRTFEVEKAHLSDPSLYFRIAAHGLALVVDDSEFLYGRIKAATELFRLGSEQLGCLSPGKKAQGLVWAANFDDFLTELAGEVSKEKCSKILPELENLHDSSAGFAGRIERLETSRESDSLGRERYAYLLQSAFGLNNEPEELYETLQAERERLGNTLHEGALRRGYRADQWRLAAVDPPPVEKEPVEPIELYRSELHRLADWLSEQPDAGDIDTGLIPEVRTTPGYLRGLRAMASYAAGVGPGNRGIFYIAFAEDSGEPDTCLARHSDYRYITVHESFPGHHHLDTVRRNLESPIRTHSENALFYEGWACWAEQRMADLGYFTRPNELMCLQRRRFQRCLRSICDVGLHLGFLDDSGAAELMERIGLKGKLAAQCILQYRCQPGYQLTYTIGRLEMERLVGRFRGLAPNDRELYQSLLAAGEIPFDLLERHLERCFCHVSENAE